MFSRLLKRFDSFQASEKNWSWQLLQLSPCSMEERIWGGLYSAIFTDLIQLDSYCLALHLKGDPQRVWMDRAPSSGAPWPSPSAQLTGPTVKVSPLDLAPQSFPLIASNYRVPARGTGFQEMTLTRTQPLQHSRLGLPPSRTRWEINFIA